MAQYFLIDGASVLGATRMLQWVDCIAEEPFGTDRDELSNYAYQSRLRLIGVRLCLMGSINGYLVEQAGSRAWGGSKQQQEQQSRIGWL